MKDLPFFLTAEEVLAFHADQIREFGGSEGIRDEGGLDSAVAQAKATFDGEYLHKGVFEMAAAYAFHIAENQPFLDGSKRTALNAAIAFLGLNGFDVIDPDWKLFWLRDDWRQQRRMNEAATGSAAGGSGVTMARPRLRRAPPNKPLTVGRPRTAARS